MLQHRTCTLKVEQGIIIDAVEGLTIDDYADGLEQLMNLNQVRFISKISGNRICVFLAEKSIVDKVIGKKINVKGHY